MTKSLPAKLRIAMQAGEERPNGVARESPPSPGYGAAGANRREKILKREITKPFVSSVCFVGKIFYPSKTIALANIPRAF
jgi:hypothetical protein